MSKVRLGDVAIEVRETSKCPEGLPVVGLEHLLPSEITLTQWSDTSDNTFNKLFHKGQILFGRRRAYLKKAAVAPFDGVCSGDITVIAAKPERLLTELLPFIISNDAFFDYAMEKSAGSLSPRVKWAQLAEYEFDLPELEEQQKLANLLWAMERPRNAYQDLLIQADELVKSQFVEMFNPVVSMQNEWAKYSLSEMADVGSSKRVFVDELKPEGVPFFRGTEVGALAEGETITPELFITEEHYETLKALSGAVTKGDLLLPSICPDGRIWQVNTDKPFYFKDGRVLWIHPKQQVINSTYLLYCLKTIFAEKYDEIASGTTFAELKIFSLKALQISLPPLELQQRFEFLVQNTDKSKLAIRQALESLEKRRSAIMTKVFG